MFSFGSHFLVKLMEFLVSLDFKCAVDEFLSSLEKEVPKTFALRNC